MRSILVLEPFWLSLKEPNILLEVFFALSHVQQVRASWCYLVCNRGARQCIPALCAVLPPDTPERPIALVRKPNFSFLHPLTSFSDDDAVRGGTMEGKCLFPRAN